MVTTEEVINQFRSLGVKPSFWARAEIKELTSILVPGERLTNVVFGWYDNGFALLCCTEQRVLLIDKKPFFLTLEDVRYDKISEVRFLNRLLDSTLVLSYAGMKLDFKSWNQSGLRKLTIFVQEAIMRINQQEQGRLEYQSNRPQQLWPAAEPQAAGMSYELTSYPEQFMQGDAPALSLPRNPYAPTNKFLRKRVPKFGFNESSR